MMKVLQICNKPPYPPIDGGCIAMNNITEGLSDMGVCVDVVSISTRKHPAMPELFPDNYLEKTQFEHVKVDTEIKIKDAFFNLFSNDSYNVQRFISKKFSQLLENRLNDNQYDIILIESLYVTPYIDLIRSLCETPIVLRAHNLEHVIWERMVKNTINPVKRQYLSILAKRLKNYEAEVIKKIDAIAAITELDAFEFQRLGFNGRLEIFPVGYSMKDLPMNRDFKKGSLFHLASMDWHPNQEAVNWFLDKVWSKIQANFPLSKLYLAGRGMSKKMKNLDINNVEIVGEVHSAKDFIVEHDIMIVPLLSGSGMRVKLIEGMALGKTIITTSIGAEGIEAEDNQHLIIADTPEEFAAAITKCLKDTPFKESIGLEAQRLIASKYSNKSISSRLIYFFDQLIHAGA
jgi:glycosyltransferase involved in cell wall biosynthesis